jgi:glycosyltransferase involved in cell wall biosynthesis
MMKQARLISIDLGIEDGVGVLGNFSQAHGAQVMRQSDAYLALKFMDTCPNLVIEALASGVPVIFSNTGGTQELVDKNCGYGLHVEGDWYSQPMAPDSDLMAEAMQSIVQRRWEMGEAARSRAEEHFDLRNWHLRHKTVFNQLLEGKGQV